MWRERRTQTGFQHRRHGAQIHAASSGMSAIHTLTPASVATGTKPPWLERFSGRRQDRARGGGLGRLRRESPRRVEDANPGAAIRASSTSRKAAGAARRSWEANLRKEPSGTITACDKPCRRAAKVEAPIDSTGAITPWQPGNRPLVIALEEHYWDADVAENLGPARRAIPSCGGVGRPGALRLKEMDEAGNRTCR